MSSGIPQGSFGTSRVVSSVKVYQTPGGHQTGNVNVLYRATGATTTTAVSNPSATGFSSRSVGAELEITFDAVETDMIEVQLYAHAQTDNAICVGLSEMKIYGCQSLSGPRGQLVACPVHGPTVDTRSTEERAFPLEARERAG